MSASILMKNLFYEVVLHLLAVCRYCNLWKNYVYFYI